MRLNGCPSLTLRDSPDPLREDPIAYVDDTCVGCGVCGEVAHAACPVSVLLPGGGHHEPWPVDAMDVAAAGRGHRPPRHVYERDGRGPTEMDPNGHRLHPDSRRRRAGGRRAVRVDRRRGARHGLRVHGTSIPGVAQRTGSTTYYVELYERPERRRRRSGLLALSGPGALDVLVAPEFLEVGRMIELGFVSPLRTTVVASTHRLYSIHEKIATGRAIYPQADLQRAAEAAARRLVAFDALTLAREHGTETNAILLGALAASACCRSPTPRSAQPSSARASR
jgi:Pyruvate/2-oxoacid:ferredoxin oxidoreductase gamma subunit